jgi:hypothetical protein
LEPGLRHTKVANPLKLGDCHSTSPSIAKDLPR